METTILHGWDNFYVIVGSSAGALIGLQFVVLTLIAQIPFSRHDAQAGNAFATPSVVHFVVVLLLAAIITAPWQGIRNVAILWGLVGHGGIVYTGITTWRLRTQKAYKPVLEDWLFHVVLAAVAYLMLAGSSYVARAYERQSLFFVGASALLLLFIGIHNAWDGVTYHVLVRSREERTDDNPK
jgi:hypothetical protein